MRIKQKIYVKPESKNPDALLQSFFFVDKEFEISNLEMIRDMDKIIKLEELLSILR